MMQGRVLEDTGDQPKMKNSGSLLNGMVHRTGTRLLRSFKDDQVFVGTSSSSFLIYLFINQKRSDIYTVYVIDFQGTSDRSADLCYFNFNNLFIN